MFIGEYKHNLDIKGRLAIPAKFRNKLRKGAVVLAVEKKGGWSKIRMKSAVGWVRTMKLQFPQTETKPRASSSILGLATGRQGSGNIVATAGIRGLDETKLKNAQFNQRELELAESYRATHTKSQGFALKADLKARRIPYIDE